MPKTLLDFYNELIGFGGESLDPDLAKTLIQRAHTDILESRTWSFLIAEGVLQVPDAVTAGAVTTTRFSTSVTTDATAKAALDAAENINIPLSTRQFRTGVTSRVYNISSYDTGTGVITLEEPYSDTSSTATGYSVFKCFYRPPTDDFLRFISIRDLTNGRPLRLGVQKVQLDRADPQRTSTEPPVLLSSYKADTDGIPLFELWPQPTVARGYVALYQKRGTVLTADTDTLPASIPDELLMVRARYHLGVWNEMAKGRDPSLRLTDQKFIIGEALARYKDLLHKAWVRDDEINPSVTFDASNSFLPPSASWLQQHDWPSW